MRINVLNCFKNRRIVRGPFSREHCTRRWISLIYGSLVDDNVIVDLRLGYQIKD